ncbi:MAG: hypothetical protein NC102_03250 [Clostridium sp.]|nr:hypothetical protein [Clostridium sp.]
MTAQQKREIVAYLSGPRIYEQGVALYQRYGANLRLKRQFAFEDTAVVREMLYDELRKLSGLTEEEFRVLPRLAMRKLALKIEDCHAPEGEAEEMRPKLAEAPETARKMIGFRQRYPFLSEPDCPDALKVLVADMFTAYGKYKAAHTRLQELGDEDSAAAAADCEAVVEEYLKNREIWDELEFYKENGVILGKAAKFREMAAAEDLLKMDDLDLMNQLRSAAVNESKHKKAAGVAAQKGEPSEKSEAAYQKWAARKQALKAELERRKKK